MVEEPSCAFAKLTTVHWVSSRSFSKANVTTLMDYLYRGDRNQFHHFVLFDSSSNSIYRDARPDLV